MLNLLPFFSFLFEKMHNSCRIRFLNTPKHRKEQKMWCPVFQGQGTFFADEERRGGVAAIEQPR